MLSQLFRRGEAQMGREEGGGENGTPLEHLALPHHAEPCQSPAVGPLPWLPALLPSPSSPPRSGRCPESALGFLLGGWGQTPSCSGKGGLALGLQGPPLPSSGAGTVHSMNGTESARLRVCSSPPGKLDLSTGVRPEAQPSPWDLSPKGEADGEGEPLPRLEEGPERAWAPQEAPEPSLGVRGEAGWERPSSRGASRAPPPQAQGSGLDSSLRPSQPTGQGQGACRDLEPKLSRVRTPGTLVQAEPQQAPSSGGAVHACGRASQKGGLKWKSRSPGSGQWEGAWGRPEAHAR